MKVKSTFKQSLAILIAVTLLTTGATTYAAYTRDKEITLTVDGVTDTVSTKATTVGAMLKEAGYHYTERSQINLPLETEISDYMQITVDTQNTVRLSLYNTEGSIHTAATTVGEFLEEQNLSVKEGDVITPSPETKIHDGLTVSIDRMTQTKSETTEAIPFETTEEYTDELYEGETRIVQEGIDGEKKITTIHTRFNGSVLPDTTTEEVVTEVQNEIIEIGTAIYVEPEVSEEETYEYTESYSDATESYSSGGGEWMNFTATAYDPSVGDTTRMGTPARLGVIAVDPDVIPLGSIVEVEGYGTFSAEDTGGAINGRKIDIFVSTYDEAMNFGVRSVRVRVIQ